MSEQLEYINEWLASPKIPSLVKVQVKGLIDNKLIHLGKLKESIEVCTYASQPERALPFAMAMQFLDSNSTSAYDTYVMAKKRNRPINVNWSPARWKEEHDKLSRLETFEKLAESNKVYDVSFFEMKLSARWPGYIIRNSRRLAMEGLRQRHCVAMYDERCASNTTCIVVVFLDKQRWTVELLRNRSDSITLVQAATRMNKQASQEIKNKLHQILGIQQPAAHKFISDEDENSKLVALRILETMRRNNIAALSCCFDGSGDSGQVDDATYKMIGSNSFKRKPELDVTVPVRTTVTEYSQEEGRYIKRTEMQETKLLTAFENLVEQVLDETGVNWYNNEGGYGEMTLFAGTGTFEYEVRQRFTNSNLVASDTWELDEEEHE